MTLYAVCMFAAAAVFLGLAAAVYRGNTDLIHSCHQKHVKETDRKSYGRAFSKGLFALAVSQFVSGAAALLGETASIVMAAIGILFVGMIVSFLIIAKVQKHYNGGFW